jgi:hypothetical protein
MQPTPRRNTFVFTTALSFFALTANAAIITNGTYTFSGLEPMQEGRVFRNGVPSDWGTAKAFPGTTDDNGMFAYTTIPFNVGADPFIQITYQWFSGSGVFAVLYSGTTYDPNALSANYVGDAGSSVSNLTGMPRTFRVDGVLSGDYLLVLSGVSAGAITGTTIGYCVEGFPDTSSPGSCTDFGVGDPGVPEPSTLVFVALALGLAGLAKFRRRPAL